MTSAYQYYQSVMSTAAVPFSYGTMPTLLCCVCGVDIEYNAANMCVSCLRNQHDVSEGIKTSVTIFNCRGCSR